MNVRPYLTPVRVVGSLAAVFGAVMLFSFVANQCSQWRTPKPFPPLVDAGTPVAGPSSAAPTITAPLEIARPALTVAELREAAKKYGLELTTKSRQATTDLQGAKRQQSGASADVLTPTAAQTFPMFLGEERFVHAPSGVSVDVAAWLAGFGERVDLRARWREWTPPPEKKIPVCQTGGWIENEAKFVKEVGAGYVYGGGKAGPGAWASASYRGVRTGAVTWGGRAFGAFSAESGAVGVGGFTASW